MGRFKLRNSFLHMPTGKQQPAPELCPGNGSPFRLFGLVFGFGGGGLRWTGLQRGAEPHWGPDCCPGVAGRPLVSQGRKLLRWEGGLPIPRVPA